MSQINNRNYMEVLLIEYMSILRQQTTRQSNIIQSFIDSQQRNFDNTRSLLQRYLENQTRTTSNRTYNTSANILREEHVTATPSTPSTSLPYVSNFGRGGMNTRSNQQSPISNSSRTNYTTNNLRRRRRPRTYSTRPTTNASRNRQRNILTQILETTLYTSPTLRPATSADISRNVTTNSWSEISHTTDQTLCPITQEHFQATDRVSRIEHCGHLFMEDALSTYLTQFDHRCPVCRYNISSTIYPPRTYAEAAATPPNTTEAEHTFPNFSTQFFDVSFNLGASNLTPNIGSRNLTRQNSFDISFNPPTFTFDLNNDFNSAVNELSNAMVSSLTNAMTNPDNSGNTITAEYSLFLPSSVTTSIPMTDNSTNTDEPGEAEEPEDEDDDTITY